MVDESLEWSRGAGGLPLPEFIDTKYVPPPGTEPEDYEEPLEKTQLTF